nr:V-set and Ig domain-containing protein isoform X1 [Nothobranchius furzeri]
MEVLRFCGSLVLLLFTGAFSSGDDSWSMNVLSEVRGIDGYPVVLPCTFSHPQHSQHSALQVLWRLGHGQEAIVLYHCTSRLGAPNCEPGPQQDQRYRLEGNPREHDLSLRINIVTLQDDGHYYCRVEVQGREHISFEDKMGTRLRVEAPPKIQTLLVEGSEQFGFTALCRVQGSPVPEVQWFGPDDLLEGSHTVPLAQGSRPRHLTVSRLRGVKPDQQYTCKATNLRGKDQASLHVLHPRSPVSFTSVPTTLLLLLSVALGAKVVLMVGMGVWMVQGQVLQEISSWRN